MCRQIQCLVFLLAAFLNASAWGQEKLAIELPAMALTPQHRLLLQQAEQLVAAGQQTEALPVLKRLLRQLIDGEQRGESEVILAVGGQRAGTIEVDRYGSATEYVAKRMATIGSVGQQAKFDSARYERIRKTASIAAARRFAFDSAEVRDVWRAKLLYVDCLLEAGYSLAAIQVLESITPELLFRLQRGEISEDDSQDIGDGQWSWLVLAGDDSVSEAMLESRLDELVGEMESIAPELLGEVVVRVWAASRLSPEHMSASANKRFLGWLLDRASDLQQANGGLERIDVGYPATDGSVVDKRIVIQSGKWPLWSARLERLTSSHDATPAGGPRVGERELGSLPYVPSVWRGKLLVNELHRLSARELDSGERWPARSSQKRGGAARGGLDQSGLVVGPVSIGGLIPRDRPAAGVPRGHVELIEDCAYARLGSAVTGWLPDVEQGGLLRTSPRILSQIVGIDLAASEDLGKVELLPGFPIRIDLAEFPGGEFEGPPKAFEETIIVPVAQRTNVGLDRSLAAMDRWTGEMVWRSGVLARGTVVGSEQSHLISNQRITIAAGLGYYNTNLGTVVCFDPANGQVRWITRYSRPDRDREAYKAADRYLFRTDNPCFVHAGIVVCFPADCGEVFALNATTGDLIWSTDAQQLPSVTAAIGVHETPAGNWMLLAGDSLAWVNLASGEIAGRFPSVGTPGFFSGVPQPRGLGRGILHQGLVYYPVADEVLVFDAEPPERVGPIEPVHRIRLDSRGAMGGNLLVHGDYLVFASPSQLMVLRGDSKDAEDSE
ncbi:MAG TPA: hypothetical protein DDW52_07000 [Planctomycetaceae bacterium]|nr:hypothetical protein [Planctomycetaceae bacterium]